MSSAPRAVAIIVTAALTSSLVACGPPAQSAHPAGARPASPPAVQVQADVTGWSRMAERPHTIYVGMGGAPVAQRLAWRHWGSPQASASGTLDLFWPQPGPISGWRPTTYPVTVRLRDIQVHNGQLAYRAMAYRYVNHRGIPKVLQFRFYVQAGGSVPSWNPGQSAGQSTPPRIA